MKYSVWIPGTHAVRPYPAFPPDVVLGISPTIVAGHDHMNVGDDAPIDIWDATENLYRWDHYVGTHGVRPCSNITIWLRVTVCVPVG